MEHDPIAAALELLPWWVPWANVLVVAPLGALVVVVGTGVAGFAAGSARAAVVRHLAVGGPVVVALLPFVLHDELQHLSNAMAALLTWLAARAAVVAATRRWRATSSGGSEEQPWHESVGVVALLASRLARPAIAVAVACTIDPARPTAAAAIALAGLATYLAASRAVRITLLRRAQILRPPSPRVADAVASAARRANRPLPIALEIDLPFVTASAAPVPGIIVFSRRAVSRFDDAELAALCTGFLDRVEPTRAPRLAVALGRAMLLLVAAIPLAAPHLHVAAIVATLATLFVAALIASRKAEGAAEARAVAFAQGIESEPGSYERARAKLGAAEREPLPRGERPPRSWRAIVAKLAGATVMALPITFAIVSAIESTLFPAEYLDWPRDVVLAVGHQPQDELLHRAAAAQQRGDTDATERFVAAAKSLPPPARGLLRRIAEWLYIVSEIEDEPDER